MIKRNGVIKNVNNEKKLNPAAIYENIAMFDIII